MTRIPDNLTLGRSLYLDDHEKFVNIAFRHNCGVACENLNRSWIGIEKNERYCEIAAKRIESAASQKTIDDFL